MATKRVFKYVNGLKIEVLAPWGPRERKEPVMGWLNIWHEKTSPEAYDIIPDKRIWCARSEITKAVKYWEDHRVTGVRKFEFVPENSTDALMKILADETPTLTALERIMA